MLPRAAALAGLLFMTLSVHASPTALRWQALPALPDPEGFASSFAGVSNHALLVVGGANFPEKRPWEGGQKVWYDTVYVLEKTDAAWRVAGKVSRPIAYGVSVTARDGVICAGGGDAAGHFRTVFRLRWKEGRVIEESLPPLPAASAFGSGALVGDDFYLAGGIERSDSTSAQATLWRLRVQGSADTAQWESLPPCPGPARMLAQAGAIDGKFFFGGGVTLSAGADGKAVRTYLRDAYLYDPAKGWKRLADLPHPVAAAPSPIATAGTKAFIVSGDDGSRTALIGPQHPGFKQEVLVYDLQSDTWITAKAEAPISRATAPTAEWNGRWIVASGEKRPGFRSNEVWSVEIAP